MKKLQQLREERAQLAAQATALNDQYRTEHMPASESTKLDKILNDIERVDAQLDSLKLAGSRALAAFEGQPWTVGQDQPVRAMRTGADFRAHYSQLPDAGVRNADSPKLGDFMRGVAGMRTTQSVQNALSIGTDAAGGYAVPSLVMPQILEAMVPASSLLSAGAGIVPLNDGAKNFTTVAVDSIPTAAWRLESGAVAASDPVFRAVVAAPKSLAFLVKLSRELLQDAVNIDGAITTAIAQAFAKEMDRAGLIGTGTNPEPRGILNTTNVLSVTNGANGASLATNRFGNLLSGVQAILQADGPLPTAAIMSPRSLVGFGSLADTTNQPLELPPLLSDMTMLATSQISNTLTVGTSSDCTQIFLGDFTKVNFMMREKLHVQYVDQLYAGTGEVAFVCHARVDIAVMYPKAFAVITGVRP